MSILEILRAAGARTDGVTWDKNGNLVFVATNAHGAWSDDEKRKVLRALGRATDPSSSPS